jgi:hypothetical protein
VRHILNSIPESVVAPAFVVLIALAALALAFYRAATDQINTFLAERQIASPSPRRSSRRRC